MLCIPASYKKPKGRLVKTVAQEQARFIEAYQQLKEKKEKEDTILLVDGVYPTMATRLSYGWSRKEKEKPIVTTALRTRANIVENIHLPAMRIAAKEYKSLDSEVMTDYW
jgi:galactokinase/mevalonate kinase-like predicted kinase